MQGQRVMQIDRNRVKKSLDRECQRYSEIQTETDGKTDLCRQTDGQKDIREWEERQTNRQTDGLRARQTEMQRPDRETQKREGQKDNFI